MKNLIHCFKTNPFSKPEAPPTPTKPSSPTSSPIAKLPLELIGKICSYLTCDELTTASVLNFRFNSEARRLQNLPWKVNLSATNVTDYIFWMIKNPEKAAKVTHFTWNPKQLAGRDKAKTPAGREKTKIVVRFSRGEFYSIARRLQNIGTPNAIARSHDFFRISNGLPRTKQNTYWNVDSVEVRDLLFGTLQWMPGLEYLEIGFPVANWDDEWRWPGYVLSHMTQLHELKIANMYIGLDSYRVMLGHPSLQTLHMPWERCPCGSWHPLHHRLQFSHIRETLEGVGSSVQTIHYGGVDVTYKRRALPLTFEDYCDETDEYFRKVLGDMLFDCPMMRAFHDPLAVATRELFGPWGTRVVGAGFYVLFGTALYARKLVDKARYQICGGL